MARMRILVIGSSIKPRPCTARYNGGRALHGFTLLELLAVTAVLHVDNGRGRVLADAARQLTAAATLVEQEAILRRRPLGMAFYRNGYRVVRFETRWSAPDGDRIYRYRTLPYGIDVIGAPVREVGVNGELPEPSFVMFPDGDVAMSELILADANGRSLRLVPKDGRFHIQAHTR